MKIIKEEPAHIEELKLKANTKDNWKIRMEAVKELAKYDCQKSRYMLTKLATSDRVFAVKEAAFYAARFMGVMEKGEPLKMPRKKLGYDGKAYTKIFNRVKRDTQMEVFDLAVFKKQFQVVSPEMYDVMQYEKQDGFDAWIADSYANLG